MSGQAYMNGLDENVSPAVIKDDVRKLQSKNRTLTFCTAFTLLLAFVGFCPRGVFRAIRRREQSRARRRRKRRAPPRTIVPLGVLIRVLPLPRLRVVDQQAPTPYQDV